MLTLSLVLILYTSWLHIKFIVDIDSENVLDKLFWKIISDELNLRADLPCAASLADHSTSKA